MINFIKRKRCFIIAEISANHGHSFKRAVSLIKESKKCGADAVKFQTYTADTLTIDVKNKFFVIKHPKWGGQTLYELYRKAYTPWSWFKELKAIADDLGIVFFSTAFDKTAVDFLEALKVPLHKISSFELVDIPLIEYAAKTKKPLIISTGMGSMAEINDALKAAKKDTKQIALLKCVSNYPAKPNEMNLSLIPYWQKRLNLPIGLSDHTLGIGASVAAVSLGARIIEKHFTLSRNFKTADSFFSLEPHEFRDLVNSVRIAENSIGQRKINISPSEKKMRKYRRSLFIVKPIKKGEKFTGKNIRSIRPAYGLKPKYFNKVLGKRSNKFIKMGTPLKWSVVS